MAIHSSHHCIGGWDVGADVNGQVDLGSVDAPWPRLVRNQKERSCLFRNVCFNGSAGAGSGSWVYFASDDELSAKTRMRAGVDVWARGDFGRMGEISEDHSFAIVRSAVPPAAIAESHAADAMLIKLAALAPSNFGHFLGNALYPAFQAAWRFHGERAKELPLQLLVVGLNQSNASVSFERCLRWARQHEPQPVGGGGARAGRRRGSIGRHRKPIARQPPAAAAAAVAADSTSAATGRGRRLGWLAAASDESLYARAVARCEQQAATISRFGRELLPGLSDAPLLWESVSTRPAGQHRARTRPARHPELTGAQTQMPTTPPRAPARPTHPTAGALPQLTKQKASGLLCTRELLVGTGDLGFSTVYRLHNGTRRRPPLLLWDTFVSHLLRRLDRRGLADDQATASAVAAEARRFATAAAARHARSTALPATPSSLTMPSGAPGSAAPLHALLIVKHGRRAPLPSAYTPLRGLMEEVLHMAVVSLQPAGLPLAVQLAYARRACVGVAPDGGTSFLLAFLPRGGALLVLGSLERWLWSNDGRLRAFYCQPSKLDASQLCPAATDAATSAVSTPASPTASSASAASVSVADLAASATAALPPPSADCYPFEAFSECARQMLERALAHVRLSWPDGGRLQAAEAPLLPTVAPAAFVATTAAERTAVVPTSPAVVPMAAAAPAAAAPVADAPKPAVRRRRREKSGRARVHPQRTRKHEEPTDADGLDSVMLQEYRANAI